jgi:glucose/arabinose dehydrogenase
MRKRWLLVSLVMVAGILSARALSQSTRLVNAFPHLSFNKPIFLTGSADSSNRIFVVQQDGIIKVFVNDTGALSTTTFLDISSKISSSVREEGLLGLAFHPRYAANGYFYVNYTAPAPLRTVIARYSVSPTNPDKADSLSEQVILEVSQPYSNHNGGMIMFGLDRCLYVGMGDGGSVGDPQNRAQNLDSLLGKILRINVDTVTGVRQYGIPADNPFAGNLSGWKEEIYAYGFRNPWRFSQDKETKQIWVGDVGQDTWEEIDILEKGKNYGWRIMEGRQCYNPATGCDTTGLTMPVAQYSHLQGECSITGGYVYRGHARPDLVGDYIYADYCSGKISRLRYRNGVVISDSVLITLPFLISSFGMDRERELYVCTYDGGTILRFEASPVTTVRERIQKWTGPAGLGQNYPNPFNPETVVSYEIPGVGGHLPPGKAGGVEASNVKLAVYDILGREVAVLVNERQAPGSYSVRFDADGLASGVYFYRIESAGFVQTRKMIIAR